MVDDDLPAVVCVFEDEREKAFCVAAILLAALDVVFAQDNGKVLVERMNLEVGVGEGSHGCFGGVVVLVLVDHAREAAEDLVSDEEGIGRVFESAGEGDEVTFIPGVFLGDQDLDDVEFLTGGGVKRVRFLRGEEGGVMTVRRRAARRRKERSVIGSLREGLVYPALLSHRTVRKVQSD